MEKLGTRFRNNALTRSLRRSDNQTYNQNPGLTYTASTITFTNPNTISDSASGFNSAWTAGMTINVKGSDTNGTSVNVNDGNYILATVAAGTLTTVEQTITTDSNAQTVTIFPA